MNSTGYDSPTTIDAPLEYITVDNYTWPKPPPPQRARLDEKERRRRHNECQKRFLARKRRDFEQLHHDLVRLEMQVKLMTAMRETQLLENEHTHLLVQLNEGVSECPNIHLMKPIGSDTNDLDDVEALVVEVVKALDVDELVAELGPL